MSIAREGSLGDTMPTSDDRDDPPSTYQEELRTFLFLTVAMAPILAVAIVGGYGFAVWMYQLITGDLPG
jgi:periplasmic nitrate reductase NapE